MKTPLLVLSDAPTSSTGLGRITRELCQHIAADLSDTFRLGSLGFGGGASRSLPWEQWRIQRTENFVAMDLEDVWQEFAGDEGGVLLTIWNPSWVDWLSDPKRVTDMSLRRFLENRPFELWCYVPVDGDGIGGRLPESVTKAIAGFDRVLAYTDYGAKVIDRSLVWASGQPAQSIADQWRRDTTRHVPVQHLPHGLDRTVFFPRDRREARRTFMQKVKGHGPEVGALREGLLLLNCIATNSARKCWPLAMETLAELVQRGAEAAMWCHTDALQRHWDLVMLADEFGVTDRIVATIGKLTNEQMAQGYAASDIGLGIAEGGGFEYPVYESIACGVPAIHCNYAGAAEFLPEEHKIEPITYRYDGFHAIKRPVSSPQAWADRVLQLKGTVAELPSELNWENLWPRWRDWLVQGVTK